MEASHKKFGIEIYVSQFQNSFISRFAIFNNSIIIYITSYVYSEHKNNHIQEVYMVIDSMLDYIIFLH
jgi:hypothetical protein